MNELEKIKEISKFYQSRQPTEQEKLNFQQQPLENILYSLQNPIHY